MIKQKFVYIDAFGIHNQHWLIVKDVEWYYKNHIELENWVKENTLDCDISGMILFFKNLEELTFFLLKWEG